MISATDVCGDKFVQIPYECYEEAVRRIYV